MTKYYIKRTLFGASLILGLLVIIYLLVYIAPGNPAYVWAGRPRGPKAVEAIKQAEKELGLDQPLYVQIALLTARFLTGDWGVSIAFKQPVLAVVARSFKATIELLTLSYILAIPLGLMLGIFTALRRGSSIDMVLKITSSIFISIPRFWFALILVLVFYLAGLQPLGRIDPRFSIEIKEVTGFYTVDSALTFRLDILLDVLVRLTPPALVIAVYPLFSIARYVRYSLSERFYEDYVMEAISLGISRQAILARYALRGTIPAVVQLAGMNFVYSFVEAAVVEIIFMREGVGRILLEGLLRSDYPLIVAVFFVVSLTLVIVNTATDVIQKKLDPRVKI
ncbi:MAG: ABC transporter permease [Sulfolobales archaeon]|nr:ABC transporter permease [Sulfolobales archaeon]MDW8083465.1 ABC transporter permease [Sulfolobales archaeon]